MKPKTLSGDRCAWVDFEMQFACARPVPLGVLDSDVLGRLIPGGERSDAAALRSPSMEPEYEPFFPRRKAVKARMLDSGEGERSTRQ